MQQLSRIRINLVLAPYQNNQGPCVSETPTGTEKLEQSGFWDPLNSGMIGILQFQVECFVCVFVYVHIHIYIYMNEYMYKYMSISADPAGAAPRS